MENPDKSNNNAQPITNKQKIECKVLKTTIQDAIVDIASQLPEI